MSTTSNPLGDRPIGKLVWWALGILAGIVVSSGGAWLQKLDSASGHHGERLSALESQAGDQRHQLDRIDRKLDRILEHEERKP